MIKSSLLKYKKLFTVTLVIFVLLLSVSAAGAVNTSPNAERTYREDFESYFGNSEGIWGSKILTYSAPNGQVCPQNTEKGISVSVTPANGERASLNIFTGKVQNRIKLNFDVFVGGSLSAELEDENRKTELISVSGIERGKWQRAELAFDAAQGAYDFYIDGEYVRTQKFFSGTVSVVRLCVNSGNVLFDNIEVSIYEPFKVAKLMYRSDGELSESYEGRIPSEADCAAVRFTQSVDSGSVAGNASLVKADGTEISAWFHAEDSIIFIAPEDGFETGESYRIVFGNNISSGFKKIGEQTCIDFTVLDENPNKDLFRCDFNSGDSEKITAVAEPQRYFKQSYEDEIGGRSKGDYAYKIFANQQGSQSGKFGYTMKIAIPQSNSEIVTAEFDLFDGITGKTNAKQNQIPYIVISSSDTSVLYMYSNSISGINWTNIGLGGYTEHLGKWIRIALSVDRRNKTYDLYMNGNKICDSLSMGEDYIDNSEIKLELAYYYDAPGENCFIAVDNVRCYEGDYISRNISDFKFNRTETAEETYVSVSCEYTAKKKPVMLAAMYNNGVLVKVSASCTGENGHLSNGILIPKNKEWTDIRAFVWEDMKNICPMAKSITLNKTDELKRSGYGE